VSLLCHACLCNGFDGSGVDGHMSPVQQQQGDSAGKNSLVCTLTTMVEVQKMVFLAFLCLLALQQ
jgi:hypothetical protein